MRTCSECTRPSENKRYDCPPRMSDGRHFTDYRPRCLTNDSFQSDQPMTSFEYRNYLTQNASTLIEDARKTAYKQNMCGPCVEPYDQGTMVPEQTVTVCDAHVCKFIKNDEAGIGMGRSYTNSIGNDAKRNFLKHKHVEQDTLRKTANCCAPNDTYFPIQKEYVGRYSNPSGAWPSEANDVFA